METELTVEQAEAQRKEAEKRLNFILRKKGLDKVRDDYLERLDRVEVLKKQYGITPEDVRAGRVPQDLIDAAEEAEKYRIRAEGTLQFHADRLKKNPKEREEYETEYNQGVKIEADEATYKEAVEKYKANPSKENAISMIKARNLSNGGIGEGCRNTELTQREELRDLEQAMRGKYQARTAEKEKVELEELQKMADNTQDPEGQRIAAFHLKEKLRLKEDRENAERLFADEESPNGNE